MREIRYRTFSLNTHRKNWNLNRPNVCQLELTFACSLHCRHCYTDCYNKPEYLKKELNTEDVKIILDKLCGQGVLWLCFTGGDPLTRRDFLELYSYAKAKGFIITIFTNAYSMTKDVVECLKKKPPFVVEITLNSVNEIAYEKISQVKGSFLKTMEGIDLILKARLPLKIKTQITKDNLGEFAAIKNFVERLGLEFRPSAPLHAALDGNNTPCSLRISPEEILVLDGRKLSDWDCSLVHKPLNITPKGGLFPCAIGGGDGVHIDPCGNLVPCNCIREPKINLLGCDIEKACKKILNWVKNKNIGFDSKCLTCAIRSSCRSCPGKALLEKGSLGEAVDWHCELAHLKSGRLAEYAPV